LTALLFQNRFVIYKKGLEGEVDIAAPKLLGEKGVKSKAYMQLNPLGKMPLLVLPDGQALPESQVRCRAVTYSGLHTVQTATHAHGAPTPHDISCACVCSSDDQPYPLPPLLFFKLPRRLCCNAAATGH
jgi:hypothetical protein